MQACALDELYSNASLHSQSSQRVIALVRLRGCFVFVQLSTRSESEAKARTVEIMSSGSAPALQSSQPTTPAGIHAEVDEHSADNVRPPMPEVANARTDLSSAAEVSSSADLTRLEDAVHVAVGIAVQPSNSAAAPDDNVQPADSVAPDDTAPADGTKEARKAVSRSEEAEPGAAALADEPAPVSPVPPAMESTPLAVAAPQEESTATHFVTSPGADRAVEETETQEVEAG